MNYRTLFLCLLAAVLAGGLSFFAARNVPVHGVRGTILLDDMNELAWLRAELRLTPEQFTTVADLHHAYRPRCVEMCGRIHQAQSHLDALAAKGNTLTPELTQAIHAAARVRAECQEAMLGHLYQTAALLEPAQAQSYLRAMLPMAVGTPSPGATHAGR
jgi:hypothetical protein